MTTRSKKQSAFAVFKAKKEDGKDYDSAMTACDKYGSFEANHNYYNSNRNSAKKMKKKRRSSGVHKGAVAIAIEDMAVQDDVNPSEGIYEHIGDPKDQSVRVKGAFKPPLPPRGGRTPTKPQSTQGVGGKRKSSGDLQAVPPPLPNRQQGMKKEFVHVAHTPPLPKRKKEPFLKEEGVATPPRPPKRRKFSEDKEQNEWGPPTNGNEHTGLPYMYDSSEEAKRLFECLIHPVKPHKFFSELWEKKPLLVKRHMPTYNEGWFSTSELDRILREERVQFTTNIDVTTYENGKRETHNPIGRAYAPIVWEYYQNNCSVRLLNPQTFSKGVWKLLSILQEYFGSCVGANVYLTPPGTQGFAPHWDDIEAFILQLEGKKHWRLYSPRNDPETLPRYSSGNFSEQDIGEPILDVVLEAGDLLYFPRGFIHQGNTLEDAHSLHITVSTYQKNTWGDLLEKLIPRALQIAIEEDQEFRRGLPREYLNYMGVAYSDTEGPDRKEFLRKVEQLMSKLLSYAPVDAACDQMGKTFIHDSLPPVLSEAERSCSIQGNGGEWDQDHSRVVQATELEPDTHIKIIRKGALRLVTEEDLVRIYYSMENSRIYHGEEPVFIEVSADAAPAVEYLIHMYPQFTSIDSLPLDTLQEKMEVAMCLYEKGLLITGEAMQPLSESESDPEPDIPVIGESDA